MRLGVLDVRYRAPTNSALNLMAVSVLVASALIGTNAAQAVAADSRGNVVVAGITDSSALTTPTVLTGTLRSRTGSPAAAGQIVIYAWPDLTNSQVGDSFTPQPLASAVADAQGRYEVRLASSVTSSLRSQGSGVANLEAVASDPSGKFFTSFGFPLNVDEGILAPSASANGAVSAAPRSQDLTLGSLQYAPSQGNPASIAEAKTIVCVTNDIQNLGQEKALVGATYDSSGVVFHNFIYQNGQSSELGIGSSSDNQIFTFGGSYGITNTGTITYSQNGGKTGGYYYTYFIYHKFREVCNNGYVQYTVRPVSWVSGSSQAKVGTISNASYCTAFAAHTTIEDTVDTAVTWSNGISIKSQIGIDLTAKTGYDTKGTTVFSATNYNVHLCGVGGYPQSGSYLLQSQP